MGFKGIFLLDCFLNIGYFISKVVSFVVAKITRLENGNAFLPIAVCAVTHLLEIGL